jgi:hypothetical protein
VRAERQDRRHTERRSRPEKCSFTRNLLLCLQDTVVEINTQGSPSMCSSDDCMDTYRTVSTVSLAYLVNSLKLEQGSLNNATNMPQTKKPKDLRGTLWRSWFCFVFPVLGFELRTLCLATWATPQPFFALVNFQIRPGGFCPGLASHHGSSTYASQIAGVADLTCFLLRWGLLTFCLD